MAKIKISVPDELVKKYDLHNDDDFKITARNGEIRLKKKNHDSNKRQFNDLDLNCFDFNKHCFLDLH